MDSKDVALYFLTGMIALGIWSWILYSIIRNASKADLLFKTNKINMQLLAAIALRLGVEPEKVDKIFIGNK